ncbi:MAG: Trk system potassium transporter TrkA [Deltaproteobacteria bacterium]|nr:Trk system potassium transporter TrkA [Deltaproteobacteria bacterium]
MKHIVISGAGEVGRYAAQVARKEGLRVTIIETSDEAIARVENSIDARIVSGSACHAEVLRQADVSSCDVLMAATSLDEVNLLTASIGKKMGAGIVMARIHNTSYFDEEFDYRMTFGVDHFVCPEQLTARTIASDLTEPNTSQIPRFAQNEIEIRNFIVSENSAAANVALKDLKLPPGVRIALIRRHKESLAPVAGTVLSVSDRVAVIGPGDAFQDVLALFGKGSSGIQNLAVTGAGPVSEWLLQKLDLNRYRIKLFEKNLDLAERIASKFGQITVIHEDPMEASIFTGEHLEQCDAFLALEGNQEHNLLAAMQAKSAGVPNVIALVQSSGLLRILKGTGVDHLYSPRIEAARALLQIVDTAPVKHLASLDSRVALVYQVKVQPDSPGVAKALADMDFPDNAFIAAIEREGSVFCPVFRDQISSGDVLIVIGPHDIRKYLLKTFTCQEA